MKKATDIKHVKIRNTSGFPGYAQLKSSVLRRSAIIAFVIGSAMTLINQSDALFGTVTLQLLPLCLMYVTPFVVVTISQLTAFRQAWLDFKREPIAMTEESLMSTALSHGIPTRAVVTGLAVGTINSAIVLVEDYLRTGNVGVVPRVLLGQVYTLPVVFGFLSQTVSYRRAAKIFAV